MNFGIFLERIKMIDNWTTPPDEKENSCHYCGEECDNDFCNRSCRKAYEKDMYDDCD